MDIERKRDGFARHRLLVIPDSILDKIKINPLINSLYLTDIGYFPDAQYHFIEREKGSREAILIICIKGEGIVDLEGKSFKLCPNQFIFLPANTFHRYYANTENPWSIYWLHFNGTDRDLILQLFNMESPVHALTAQMLPNIIRAFYNLFDILSRGYSNRLMIHLSSTLRLLLTSLSLDEVHTHGQKLMKYNYVDICIKEMKNNIDKQMTLDQLASKVALSKNYLVNLFHRKTGYSPISYFIHLKIQAACEYLDTTDLSIKEISLRVGYQDAYYFSRIFKKVMNKSPKQYRELSKG